MAVFFMTDFKIIDAVINDFVSDKQFMTVSKDPKSDWFKFEYRKMDWSSNGLNNQIEIFPNLEPGDSYMDWNLSCISWYDEDNNRFYRRVTQLKEVTLKTIESCLKQKLSDAYVEMNSFEKKDLTEFIKMKSPS